MKEFIDAVRIGSDGVHTSKNERRGVERRISGNTRISRELGTKCGQESLVGRALAVGELWNRVVHRKAYGDLLDRFVLEGFGADDGNLEVGLRKLLKEGE